jgi:hypothetical protein
MVRLSQVVFDFGVCAPTIISDQDLYGQPKMCPHGNSWDDCTLCDEYWALVFDEVSDTDLFEDDHDARCPHGTPLSEQCYDCDHELELELDHVF